MLLVTVNFTDLICCQSHVQHHEVSQHGDDTPL